MKDQSVPSFADDIVASVDLAKERKAQKDEDFLRWQKTGNPEDLLRVVDQYKTTIDRAASAIVGGTVNPIVARRAQLLAAEAIKGYDPSRKVPLKYHIQSQLSPLRRYHRKVTESVPTPERLRREAAFLHRAKEELWDELDREPSHEELADRTGISVLKQRKLLGRQRVSKWEGELTNAAGGDDDAADFSPAVSFVDPGQEVEDYVYFDLDDEDKLIYRSRTGYRGSPVLSNAEVARALKISPGAVSQRAAKIQRRIQEFLDD